MVAPLAAAAAIKAAAELAGQGVGAVTDYYKNNPKWSREIEKALNSSHEKKTLGELTALRKLKGETDYLARQEKILGRNAMKRGDRKKLRKNKESLNKYYKLYPQLQKNFNEEFNKLYTDASNSYKDLSSQLLQRPEAEAAAASRQGTGTYNRFDPNQISAQNDALKRSADILNRPSADFESYAQNARREFDRSIPKLLETFGEGASRSPSMAYAALNAKSDFASKLEGQRADFDLAYKKHALEQQAQGLEPRYGAPISGGGGGGMQSSPWGDFARTAGRYGGELAGEYAADRIASRNERNMDNKEKAQQQSNNNPFVAPDPFQQYQTTGQKPSGRQAYELANPYKI